MDDDGDPDFECIREEARADGGTGLVVESVESGVLSNLAAGLVVDFTEPRLLSNRASPEQRGVIPLPFLRGLAANAISCYCRIQ